MTTKIIRLDQYRGGIKHAGIVFPQVYRATGYSWTFADPITQTDLIPDTRYFHGPFYVLDDTDRGTLSNAKFEPIDRLDPSVDRGWVIVRHHPGEVLMDGYLRGYWDMRVIGFDQNLGAIVYRTKNGIFTCVHREAMPNKPDHLLIFIGRGVVQRGRFSGLEVDNVEVIDPLGKDLDDSIFAEYDEEEDEHDLP
jgi:hypothetical protein